MLPSSQRLSGKDINYMLRRGRKFFGKTFVAIIIPQYRNLNFGQLSIQIPVKASKKAAMRNLLKRHGLEIFKDLLLSKPYYKIFIFVNKKNLQNWAAMLETANKTAIVKQWKTLCTQDLFFFKQGISKKR